MRWCFIEASTLGGRIEGGGGGGKGRTREDSSTVEFRRSPGRSAYLEGQLKGGECSSIFIES